jgi:hypothetical protein
LSAFNAHGVEYLVVGAYALAAHGRVRATGDLDVWVKPEARNAKCVMEALRTFGAPLHDLKRDDLTRLGTVFQTSGKSFVRAALVDTGPLVALSVRGDPQLR